MISHVVHNGWFDIGACIIHCIPTLLSLGHVQYDCTVLVSTFSQVEVAEVIITFCEMYIEGWG